MYYKTPLTDHTGDKVKQDFIYSILDLIEQYSDIGTQMPKEAIYNKAIDTGVVLQVTQRLGKCFAKVVNEKRFSDVPLSVVNLVELLFGLPFINHNVLQYCYCTGVDKLTVSINRNSIRITVGSNNARLINEKGERLAASAVFFFSESNRAKEVA